MQVTLIHNPTAGDDDHAGEALRALVAEAGHDVSYVSTKQPSWVEALEQPGDLVAVAGGDGSVGKVFREIATNEAFVTLLPVGSANNIAGSLGIDGVDLERLVAGWAGGQVQRFDVGEARAPWGDVLFVESLGGGIFGEVLARAEGIDDVEGLEVEGDEKVVFGLELLREVIEGLPALEWRIEIDGEDLSGAYLAVEAMNIGQLGPNLPLAPEADPGDGLLDVVLVRNGDRAELLAHVSERLRGLEPEAPRYLRRRGKRIVLEPAAEARLHADDRFWPEDPDDRSEGRAIVAPGPVLELLVPRS